MFLLVETSVTAETLTGRLVRVLVVDDDPHVLSALSRGLVSPTMEVVGASSGATALSLLGSQPFDVLVSDLRMPGMSGMDLGAALRRIAPDLPVIFMTGSPSIDTAMRAFELNAFRYLQKPVATAALRTVIEEAVRLRDLARSRHPDAEGTVLASRAALVGAFTRALDTLTMVYQPIVSTSTRETIGHEALMRTKEPALPHPGAVLDAAEKLGSLHVLGRATRARVAETLTLHADCGSIFVNLHSADLADAELYLADSPLARFAPRVVLEITERATLEGITDVAGRIARLRALGYRIAVDDLGAGYAGLNYFASLKPDIVKIDMSLTRNLDIDVVRATVVRSLVTLSRDLGMLVVAEGVETRGERDALVEIGCHYLQGYLLARPGPPFVQVAWP